jgi:hypothetical protein
LDEFDFEDEKEIDEEEILAMEMIRPRQYMLRQNSNLRFYWDIFIILLAIFNSISLPFSLAFI